MNLARGGTTLYNLLFFINSLLLLFVLFFRLAVHGKNEIGVEIMSYWRLLIDEILNPFYVFEILSILFWIYDTYVIYAVVIIIISTCSIIKSLIQTRQVRL